MEGVDEEEKTWTSDGVENFKLVASTTIRIVNNN